MPRVPEEKMDERTRSVLEAVIQDYIETASPVGSFHLREEYDFSFSPATIRAILSELENLGYLLQPHTSAGRIPTEKGYRFYIDSLENGSNGYEFSVREELALRKKILSLRANFERMLNSSARIISEITENAGIAGTGEIMFKHGISNLLKKPELQSREYAIGAADIFDNLELLVREVPQNIEFEIYIGGESPVGKKAGCSLIVSRFLTPYNTRGFLGVLGPTRMAYERNISLVNLIKDILEGVR